MTPLCRCGVSAVAYSWRIWLCGNCFLDESLIRCGESRIVPTAHIIEWPADPKKTKVYPKRRIA